MLTCHQQPKYVRKCSTAIVTQRLLSGTIMNLVLLHIFQTYSCLLCDYKDPVRKRLYEHWKKHHKLQVVLRPNGTARCVMNDKGDGQMELTEYNDDNRENSEVSRVFGNIMKGKCISDFIRSNFCVFIVRIIQAPLH